MYLLSKLDKNIFSWKIYFYAKILTLIFLQNKLCECKKKKKKKKKKYLYIYIYMYLLSKLATTFFFHGELIFMHIATPSHHKLFEVLDKTFMSDDDHDRLK